MHIDIVAYTCYLAAVLTKPYAECCSYLQRTRWSGALCSGPLDPFVGGLDGPARIGEDYSLLNFK